MAVCSPQALFQESPCFSNLDGPGQWEAIKLTLLCRILQSLDPMATCNVQELMTSAKFFFPVVMSGQGQALELQLLCDILANGGGGGGSQQVFSGSGAPVGLQVGQNALLPGVYYDTDPGGLTYVWNASTGGWQ